MRPTGRRPLVHEHRHADGGSAQLDRNGDDEPFQLGRGPVCSSWVGGALVEVVVEPGGPYEASLGVVETGERLEVQDVADVAGDLHRTADGVAVEGEVAEDEPVVEGAGRRDGRSRNGMQRGERGQLRFPVAGCRSGKDVRAVPPMPSPSR